MGWTSKMRANRFSQNFNKKGTYRGDKWNLKVKEETQVSDDTKKRMEIIQEIDRRVLAGEKLENVTSEISARVEVKECFSYYAKNGITDLAVIIKNWYESYKKSLTRTNNIRLR